MWKYFMDLLKHRKQKRIDKIMEGYLNNKEYQDACEKIANVVKKIFDKENKKELLNLKDQRKYT